MEAIILVGGLGTRLSSIISDLPKPMANVNGKPFLEYIFRYLKEQGIIRIILATSHRHDVIYNYFGNYYEQMEILYSYEKNRLGTGGGIKQALGYTLSNNLFVINGDTFFNVDLSKLMNFHLKKKSNITLSLKYLRNITRSGSVIINENNKIVSFDEKKEKPEGYINGGIYLINKDFYFGLDTQDSFSFEKDVLEKYYSNSNFYGMIGDEYFIDIGIPEDYARAQDDFRSLF